MRQGSGTKGVQMYQVIVEKRNENGGLVSSNARTVWPSQLDQLVAQEQRAGWATHLYVYQLDMRTRARVFVREIELATAGALVGAAA